MLESGCILNIKRYQVKIDIFTSLRQETHGLCGPSQSFRFFRAQSLRACRMLFNGMERKEERNAASVQSMM
jgi:hypothetical protein